VIHDILARLPPAGGLAAMALILVLEAAGLPLPGETAMIAAALYLAQVGRLALLLLIVIATTATVLGGAIGYGVGRRFGLELLERYGGRIGFNADRRLLAHDLMQRNGAALIIGGRFVAGLRSVAGVLAGATGMDWRRFMACNLAGGALWAGSYCTGAYVLGHAIMRVAVPLGVTTCVAVAALLAAAFLFVRAHEASLIARAKARLRARSHQVGSS